MKSQMTLGDFRKATENKSDDYVIEISYETSEHNDFGLRTAHSIEVDDKNKKIYVSEYEN